MYRTAPIGLALFDPVEFRYLRLNDRQAAFFGLKPEQVVGRTLTEMAPIEGLRELFEQVRDGTPVVNYPLEGELISHPGEHRYWTVNYAPVRGGGWQRCEPSQLLRWRLRPAEEGGECADSEREALQPWGVWLRRSRTRSTIRWSR